MSLLEVVDLHVSFPTEDGVVRAVQGLSFSIEAGQTLGIVGESGSGKSVSTQTILGLTRGARVTGQALFEGRDLLAMRTEELQAVRGAKIAMIFQDPLTSLHPHYRIGWQVVEMIRAHEDVPKAAARQRAIELLGLVGIPRPSQRIDDFPHQFSGGMRQRAMIAMALALNPKVLIADEPTTALDVTVQAQILDLIGRVQREFGTAVIMITHDLGVVAELADDVLVMYAGRPVEKAGRRALYYRPHHPYTKGLLESVPSSATSARADRLKPIKGQPPSLITLPTGCAFHPRCPYVMDACRADVPPLYVVGGDPAHVSACHLPPDELGFGADVEAARAAVAVTHRDAETAAVALAGAAEGTVVTEAPPVRVRPRRAPAAKATAAKATPVKEAAVKEAAVRAAPVKVAAAKAVRAKPAPAKAVPVKAAPAKAPAKVTAAKAPAKVTAAKAVPAKATAAKAVPAKATAAKALPAKAGPAKGRRAAAPAPEPAPEPTTPRATRTRKAAP